MVRPRTEHEEGPVFSHQVLALIARMEREDRELVGAFYGRARARHGDEKGAQAVRSMFASAKPGGGRAGHNMHLPGPLGRTRQTGTVRISVCERAVEHYAAMALMKRSPKMTANCALAMDHSRGGILHSFSERFKIR